MNYKIISWNTNYWKRKHLNNQFWNYLDVKLKPDIALLQEIVPIENENGFIGGSVLKDIKISKSKTFIGEHIDSKRKWGSGIFTKVYLLEN